MKIRNAELHDIEQIEKIYDAARVYMREHGNPDQWGNSYPEDELIRNDIRLQQLYVVEQDAEVLGVFMFMTQEEPTYQVIENGNWNSDKKYGTIHRIASSGKRKGFTTICFDYCAGRADYLRIDTHQNNHTMQAALERYGFKKCGIIYVRDGERIAFDYIIGDKEEKF